MSHILSKKKDLQPERKKFALEELEKRISVNILLITENEIRFLFKGSIVYFFPYSGWHSGASIKDGRGIIKLLKQIDNE